MIRPALRALAYVVFFLQILLVAALAGGFITRFIINEDPFLPQRLGLYLAGYTILVLSLVFLLRAMLRREKRILIFATFLFAIMSVASLFLANWVASFFTPAGPAAGLHGYKPDRRSGDLNSWGQRDRERSVVPEPGVLRMAFIGDSFVEKPQIINTLVEKQIGRPDVEVIGLGVSGSAPDEYYYRLKNIGLKLGIRHCYLFLYTGNDFVETSTLPTLLGIFAVYPRDSFARFIGLRHLNHVVTMPFRPYNLGPQNQKRHEADLRLSESIRNANDEELKNILINELVKPSSRPAVIEKLNRPEAKIFLDAIRNPDDGLFERGYLNTALWYGSGRGKKKRISEVFAYHWVKLAADLCRERGIGFTLVVVPEAAQVDPRIRALYLPLTDLKDDLSPTREAADRIMTRARLDEIDVIDLFPLLEGIPGTYLSMDGHWSKKGFEIVTKALTREVASRLPAPSKE